MDPIDIFQIILWVGVFFHLCWMTLMGVPMWRAAFITERTPLATTVFRGLLINSILGFLVILWLLVRLRAGPGQLPEWVDDFLLYAIAVKLAVQPLVNTWIGWSAHRYGAFSSAIEEQN